MGQGSGGGTASEAHAATAQHIAHPQNNFNASAFGKLKRLFELNNRNGWLIATTDSTIGFPLEFIFAVDQKSNWASAILAVSIFLFGFRKIGGCIDQFLFCPFGGAG